MRGYRLKSTDVDAILKSLETLRKNESAGQTGSQRPTAPPGTPQDGPIDSIEDECDFAQSMLADISAELDDAPAASLSSILQMAPVEDDAPASSSAPPSSDAAAGAEEATGVAESKGTSTASATADKTAATTGATDAESKGQAETPQQDAKVSGTSIGKAKSSSGAKISSPPKVAADKVAADKVAADKSTPKIDGPPKAKAPKPKKGTDEWVDISDSEIKKASLSVYNEPKAPTVGAPLPPSPGQRAPPPPVSPPPATPDKRNQTSASTSPGSTSASRTSPIPRNGSTDALGAVYRMQAERSSVSAAPATSTSGRSGSAGDNDGPATKDAVTPGEDFGKLMALQARFPDPKAKIAVPGRRLLKHGPVARKTMFGSSDGYVFLFSDSLLCCASQPAKKKKKKMSATAVSTPAISHATTGLFPDLRFQIKENFPLESVTVKEGIDSGLFGKKFKFGFSVVTKQHSSVVIGLSERQQERDWCNAIAGAVRARIDEGADPPAGVSARGYAWSAALHRGTLHAAALAGDVDAIDRLLDPETNDKADNVVVPVRVEIVDEKSSGGASADGPDVGGAAKSPAGGDTATASESKAAAGSGALWHDIDAIEPTEGATPLLIACARGDAKTAAACLRHNANPSAKDRRGRSALSLATARRALELVKLLLTSGADASEPLPDGHSLVFQEATRPEPAVGPGRKEWVTALLAGGARPLRNERASRNNTVLHIACRRYNDKWGPSAIPYLLEWNRLDLRVRNTDGDTPLHLAVQRGLKADVQLLVDAGAPPNIRNKRKRTPLFYARRPGVAAVLLRAGARPDIQDDRGKMACEFKELSRGRKAIFDQLSGAAASWRKATGSPATDRVFEAGEQGPDAGSPQSPSTKSCVYCSAEYGVMRWRYMCERCGAAVCSECSAKTVTGPNAKVMRACDGCYNECIAIEEASVRAQREAEEKRRMLAGGDYAAGSGARDGVTGKVGGQISGTKNLMAQNLQAVHERGRQLNETANAADELANESKAFNSLARQLRKKYEKQSKWLPF